MPTEMAIWVGATTLDLGRQRSVESKSELRSRLRSVQWLAPPRSVPRTAESEDSMADEIASTLHAFLSRVRDPSWAEDGDVILEGPRKYRTLPDDSGLPCQSIFMELRHALAEMKHFEVQSVGSEGRTVVVEAALRVEGRLQPAEVLLRGETWSQAAVYGLIAEVAGSPAFIRRSREGNATVYQVATGSERHGHLLRLRITMSTKQNTSNRQDLTDR